MLSPWRLLIHGHRAITDDLFLDGFESSAAFDAINSTLQSDEAERKEAIKNAGTVVAFTLKNASGKEESWHLDLKEKGVVGKGPAPAGKKADGQLLFIFSSRPCSQANVV